MSNGFNSFLSKFLDFILKLNYVILVGLWTVFNLFLVYAFSVFVRNPPK